MVVCNQLTPGLSILLNGSIASPFLSILGVRDLCPNTGTSICLLSYTESIISLFSVSVTSSFNEDHVMCSHRYIVVLRSKVIMKTLNEQ